MLDFHEFYLLLYFRNILNFILWEFSKCCTCIIEDFTFNIFFLMKDFAYFIKISLNVVINFCKFS